MLNKLAAAGCDIENARHRFLDDDVFLSESYRALAVDPEFAANMVTAPENINAVPQATGNDSDGLGFIKTAKDANLTAGKSVGILPILRS